MPSKWPNFRRSLGKTAINLSFTIQVQYPEVQARLHQSFAGPATSRPQHHRSVFDPFVLTEPGRVLFEADLNEKMAFRVSRNVFLLPNDSCIPQSHYPLGSIFIFCTLVAPESIGFQHKFEKIVSFWGLTALPLSMRQLPHYKQARVATVIKQGLIWGKSNESKERVRSIEI